VLFDFDKAEIRPAAADTLAKVAVVIRSQSGSKVRVYGYTDSKGTSAYNLELSQRRAQSVVRWLQDREKLAATPFEVRGLGAANPVAPNSKPDGSDDPKGRQRNRRVEITVQKS
jgi:outer membrane protein OmpA-like peptidoglycan-associated protein